MAHQFLKTEYPKTVFSGNFPVLMKCEIENNIQKAIINGSQEVILKGLTCDNWQARARHRTNEISVITKGDHLQLLKYSLKPGDTVADPIKIFETDGVLKEAQFLDNHYFFETRWGGEQKLYVLDVAGTLMQTIAVPSFVSFTKIESKMPGSSINVTMESPIVMDQVFEYNYVDGKWVTPVTEALMLQKNKLVYTSEVRMVPARDGVQIPVRITKLASTQLIPATPVLMDVYGGFDKAGKIYPRFNGTIRNLFLSKGGVYMAPAIRGGDEFGETWYKAAAGLNKMVSLNDVIDVANYFISQKWTSADKLVTTGTSNGGFTVAAAAFLSPKSFGLVVPVSGVYDLLGINRLDPRFAKGWWTDYGNPDDPQMKDAIKKYSPLEIEMDLGQPSLPHFLFVNGLNDSRVNSLHSIKMIEKLRLSVVDTPEKINALFIKNAGHWIASDIYQDFIALRENAIVWDAIYRQVGW
jgi:prolyl oligopeptidase PreP (S9A serine peptidase family)